MRSLDDSRMKQMQQSITEAELKLKCMVTGMYGSREKGQLTWADSQQFAAMHNN